MSVQWVNVSMLVAKIYYQTDIFSELRLQGLSTVATVPDHQSNKTCWGWDSLQHPKRDCIANACVYLCLFVWTDHLAVNFKWAHSNISRWWNVHTNVYFNKQLSKSRENEHEGLLPDCRVVVKESKSDDDLSWMYWQHARQLCELQ